MFSRLLPSLTLGLSLGLSVGGLAPATWAQEGDLRARVSVRVEPERATPGQVVTIDGIAPLDAAGAEQRTVRLRVTRPDGRVVAFEVVAAPNGDYAAPFRDTALAGEYVVDVTSPGGTITGRGRFEIEVLEPLDEVDEAVKEVAAIGAALRRITAEVDSDIGRLPDTAARDGVRAKWAETRPQLEAAVRDLGDLDDLIAPFREAARNPKTVAAVQPLASVLRDWTRTALPERTRILAQLDASKRGNAQCEAAEHIIEGTNFAAALANLMGGAVNAVKAVVVDFIAAQVGEVAAKLTTQLKFPTTEATKIAAAIYEAKLKGVLAGEHLAAKAAAKESVVANVLSLALDFSSMVAQAWFDQYCERMAGRFTGAMHAEFIAATAQPWWKYDIEFEGRIELRYAKPGADAVGLTTRVNGEILGQAIHFRSDEDAVRLGAPSLTAGSILWKRSILPQPEILNLATLTPMYPDGKPVEPKPIEIEGKVAATLVKPYTFYVPIEGEIVDGILTLRLKPATQDYEAASRTLYLLVSPLFPLLPVPTAFVLPFKGGEFFLTRAFGDGPLRVPVKKTPKALMVDETLRREKGNGRANGIYRLTFKLCNPEGKC